MTKQYIEHLEKCFIDAEANTSNIGDEIKALEGATGEKTRHFYNNLLTLKDARYLEIGTWKGSSVCSAMFKNKATVVCVDNWSEFGGPKEEFLENFTKFKGKNNATFIEADCFTLAPSSLGQFNIYMYDGNHSYEAHYKALTYFQDCLDSQFIFIVDDWNWATVRGATYQAITDLNLKTLWSKEVRLTQDNSHTPGDIARQTWHNGIAVFLLEKA